MPQELPESDGDGLLAKRRSQLILKILAESTTPLSAIRLARRVGEREHECLSDDDVTSIYLSLYQNHLPRLEDLDVVTYDEDDGTVHPADNLDAFTRALDVEDDRDTAPPEEAQQGGHLASRRIDLLVRACTPTVVHERLGAVIDRLDQLYDDGSITDYSLRQWPPQGSVWDGSRLSATSSTSRQEIVAEFDAWAEEQGYTLEPAFCRRPRVTRGFEENTGERYTVPLLTLAFYEGGELTGVVPCADDQQTYTVADFLSARVPDGWIDLPNYGEQGV